MILISISIFFVVSCFSNPSNSTFPRRSAWRFAARQAEVLTSFGCSEETIATVTDESAEEVKQHADARPEMGCSVRKDDKDGDT